MSELKKFTPKTNAGPSKLDQIKALVDADKDKRTSICKTKFFKDVERIVK